MLKTTLIADPASGTTLTLRVENTGREPARFCRYQTPLEGFRGPFLEVTAADGTEVRYAGIRVKRRPPREADYREVKPGEVLQMEFDLAAAYPVPPGRYSVRFTGGLISGLPDSEPIRIEVR